MSSATYQLNPLAGLFHGAIPSLQVADSAAEHTTDVAVSSGDYFETLATMLDLVQQNLPKNYIVTKAHLEKTVSELLYLQKRYKIEKKR